MTIGEFLTIVNDRIKKEQLFHNAASQETVLQEEIEKNFAPIATEHHMKVGFARLHTGYPTSFALVGSLQEGHPKFNSHWVNNQASQPLCESYYEMVVREDKKVRLPIGFVVSKEMDPRVELEDVVSILETMLQAKADKFTSSLQTFHEYLTNAGFSVKDWKDFFSLYRELYPATSLPFPFTMGFLDQDARDNPWDGYLLDSNAVESVLAESGISVPATNSFVYHGKEYVMTGTQISAARFCMTQEAQLAEADKQLTLFVYDTPYPDFELTEEERNKCDEAFQKLYGGTYWDAHRIRDKLMERFELLYLDDCDESETWNEAITSVLFEMKPIWKKEHQSSEEES